MHRLTDVFINSLKPPLSGRAIYKDAASPLQLRVMASGAKTFFTVIGNGKRHTIGRWGEISLAAARDVARRVRAEKILGRYSTHSMPMERAIEQYLADIRVRKNTRMYYERSLSKLKGNLVSITTRDINYFLDQLGTSSRNQALASYRAFFKWCVRRKYLEHSPVDNLALVKESSRTRLLTDEEVKSIWRATGQPTTFNTIVRLLILTGQRRNEIASLKEKYIKDDVCTLPSEITKNKREHSFPIGSLASSMLPGTKSGLFFAARGTPSRPFSGFSKAKKVLDRGLGGTVAPWTLHDLRRYYASTMARLGVKQEVTERLLNHRSGIISGIAAVYTLHDFLPEMRQAVDRYEQHLRRLLDLNQ